ncbi:transcription initiation factor TFIID complex subunit [Purpureocillium lilacinum]|uniref:Transcription initiation factor TFIID complex subunit n=1 Tax=Purpureocillium lilacinum TaxID=33203 RepID=A0A179GL26_PURLI|nr:transcription initiation factor TFIID complex subunit [Purpureocillium lilacinum]OAQ76524.1 transcription initiation factor TFIID complex subunit [Purpureocillium lilacinum]OAQ78061.1 transcription initiation factor TFIID complex subunit [Purpureocillium lilacinum]GJN75928.1 hypothetical protein PLICBS_010038 [Purpureocillium lilacinum]GJN79823.1 hypothetical protein PLIIFM63780_003343 [Purpureocillium lilacinum]
MAEANGASPRAEDWKAQDAADEREIAKLLGQSQEGGADGLALDDTPFDQSGKADDAQDFEDISDDDLPDEEPSGGTSFELPGLTDDGGTSNDADDLFGEGPSSPDPVLGPSSPAPQVRDDTDEAHPTDDGFINFDPDPHLNGSANQDPDIPAAAESAQDILKAAWPAYKKGHILVWSDLLPPKRAVWKEKKPAKKPKHLVTSKQSLEMFGDQEKQFRIPGAASGKPRPHDAQVAGVVLCDKENATSETVAQFDIDQDSDAEPIHGFTLRDIEMACEDWNARIVDIEADFRSRQAAEKELQSRKRQAEQDDEWDAEFLMDADEPRPKRRRSVEPGLPDIPRYTAPSFDDFEDATQRGSKRVYLDMSDPYLLLETDLQHPSKRARLDASKMRAKGRRDLSSRFNLSNDDAYELLKENHQSKVRATLGNISVDHSMPAIKLTWPYYKVKLAGTTDEYHRPRFRYKKFAGHAIKFDKPQHFKRKQMKGKAHEVFVQSKDLSMGDNSTAVLFEYCEPRPRVLNNFGMGSKLINYYRRKDSANEEDQLPKRELGEYRMLLPEDRSPFALFGTVDAGETVPTLHNEMYRAPVFRHTPRNSDFLVVRSTTGVEGSRWYLRRVDHLHVVGQQFPSVEVPGPHSRKVTTASKNRMKMLAFRMIRHSKTDNCQLSDITKHIADSTDTQNRQKLKEFLQYDRESGEKGMWRLRPGEVVPDEAGTRAMIKPEEVSLLDSMQLGIKELEDAGYDPRNAQIDEDGQADAEGEDGEAADGVDDEASKITKTTATKKPQEKQEETLADKMAPWKTTKAFIDACQGKAMLQLHGEGDPTGHGLGFSFIRTSMKGGYIEAVQGPLATSADAMEREKRANGGHAYNVKKQQAMYEGGIRDIWQKQKSTLSDTQQHDDGDVQVNEDEDDRFNVNAAATPAHFDEGVSQISGLTTSTNRHGKRAIRISREVRMADGTTQTRIEVVHDPVVISQYMKRRTEADLELRDIYSARPTGNADHDRLANLRIKKELERLEKNKARRQAREQQKELHQKASAGDAGSPGPGAEKIPTGTTRKFPEPPLPFDWWRALEPDEKEKGKGKGKTGRRKKENAFRQMLRRADEQRAADEKARLAHAKQVALEAERAAKAAAKAQAERERLERDRQLQEQREAKERERVEQRRKAQEEQERKRQQALRDRAERARKRQQEEEEKQRKRAEKEAARPKLCPLLNGTMKADNGAAEHGGFGNYNAPTGSAGSPI